MKFSISLACLVALTTSSVINPDSKNTNVISQNLQVKDSTPYLLPDTSIVTNTSTTVTGSESTAPTIVAEIEKRIDGETHNAALVINIPGLFGDENNGIDFKNVDMDALD